MKYSKSNGPDDVMSDHNVIVDLETALWDFVHLREEESIASIERQPCSITH